MVLSQQAFQLAIVSLLCASRRVASHRIASERERKWECDCCRTVPVAVARRSMGGTQPGAEGTYKLALEQQMEHLRLPLLHPLVGVPS